MQDASGVAMLEAVALESPQVLRLRAGDIVLLAMVDGGRPVPMPVHAAEGEPQSLPDLIQRHCPGVHVAMLPLGATVAGVLRADAE